jgi:hypothetical protein
MRKWAIIFILFPLFCTGIFSSDFSIHFNIGYNHGISDFFEESQLFLSYSGKNFVEKKHNYMGFGFNVSISIPVIKKLYAVPGFTLKYGYQDYQYKEITDDVNAEDEKNSYFFNIISGEFNVIYDVFHFKSDWNISLVMGLTYNHFRADEGMMEEEKQFWGYHPGIGLKFSNLKHFGFQIFFFYELPFDSGLLSYLSTYAGILYRF